MNGGGAQAFAGSTVIVDYGCGNPNSIRNMLKKIGHRATISSDPGAIGEAERIIFPGVGAFDFGAERIETLGLASVLDKRVLQEGVPILGICVGLQLMARKSEEGMRPGLGWLDADVIRFDAPRIGATLKIPHMGWSEIEPGPAGALLTGFDEAPRFYFVHSYHLACDDPSIVAATATHGYSFTAAAGRDNIIGVQFHPEKSHAFGMSLLANFMAWTPERTAV